MILIQLQSNFEWKQGCWDPRAVGLSIDSTPINARSVLRLTKEVYVYLLTSSLYA